MPLIGKITTLLMLLLLLASCRDYEAEKKIEADAQIQIAAHQAQAQRDISYNNANAEAAVANSQKEATIAVSGNQLAAQKYAAEQATKQASIWADKLPMVATIATFALLAAIVLVYRGKIGLKRVDKEVLLLSSPLSVVPSRALSSKSSPPLSLPAWTPEPVRVVAVQRRADRVSENAAGEWLLWRDGHLLVTMRPRQLTDSQRR